MDSLPRTSCKVIENHSSHKDSKLTRGTPKYNAGGNSGIAMILRKISGVRDMTWEIELTHEEWGWQKVYLNSSKGPRAGCGPRSRSGRCGRCRRWSCCTTCGCCPSLRAPPLCHILHPIPNSLYQTNSSRLFAALAFWPLPSYLTLKRAHVTSHIYSNVMQLWTHITSTKRSNMLSNHFHLIYVSTTSQLICDKDKRNVIIG